LFGTLPLQLVPRNWSLDPQSAIACIQRGSSYLSLNATLQLQSFDSNQLFSYESGCRYYHASQENQEGIRYCYPSWGYARYLPIFGILGFPTTLRIPSTSSFLIVLALQ
jgi:hypothetical protein